jgi:hypothetical protein
VPQRCRPSTPLILANRSASLGAFTSHLLPFWNSLGVRPRCGASLNAIKRVFGTTPAQELERILALHPKLLVVREGEALRHVDPEYRRKLAAALASRYEYLKTIDRVELYRLRPFSAARPQALVT